MPDTNKQRWSITTWIFILALLALLFGLWTQHNFKKPAATEVSQPPIILTSGTLLSPPRSINPFQLKDDHNKPFTQANLLRHWNLVFFGFTNCPELCPTTLSTLNQAYKNLQTNHLPVLPQIIFISVDPKRDTPERINRYLSSFNPAFIGATGKKKQIDELVRDFNIVYVEIAQKGNQANEYTIDHSGAILLIDPAGQLYAVFSTPHDAANIAKDFTMIVDNYDDKAKA